jgi:hypothetical protein
VDLSARRRDVAGEAANQGRLSGAVFPGQRHHLAGSYIEIDVVERHQRAVAHRQVLHAQQRARRLPGRPVSGRPVRHLAVAGRPVAFRPVPYRRGVGGPGIDDGHGSSLAVRSPLAGIRVAGRMARTWGA